MATCTHAIGTAATTATPEDSGAFTPVLGDLLIGLCSGTGTILDGTLVTDAGITFTQFAKAARSSGGDFLYGFVANELIDSSADISQIATFDTPGDPTTGSVIHIFRVSGMSHAGLDAIRQFALDENKSGSAVPAVTFGAAALTGNPTLVALANGINPATVTPPTNWTEPANGDLGYASPTSGCAVAFRNSGSTDTTITWGGTYASNGCAMAVELDASVANTIIVPNPAAMSV